MRLRRLGNVVGLSATIGITSLAASAVAQPHTFVLTYRAFGPVTASSDFVQATGYDARFEGCYAKHSEEAICGFTLRARRLLTLTNLENASHGSGADGSAIRTCCMFVQGDDRGFPIVQAPAALDGVAILNRSLRAGQEIGVMLRVPEYRKAETPLTTITLSRGKGDRGVSFPTRVTELP